MSGIILLLFLVLTSVLCITLCFFGYRHIRLLFTCMGVLFGGYYAYCLLLQYAHLSQTTAIIAAVIIGIILGSLSYFIYNFGIFLTGAIFGICVAIMIMTLFGIPISSTLPTVIIIVLAVCAGFLTLAYRRVCIILSTAFTGAVGLVLYGGYTIMNFDWILSGGTLAALGGKVSAFYGTYRTTLIVAMAAFLFSGLIVQFVAGKKGRRK